LYSGPNYMFHYRYASLLESVAITFMYGAVLPVLFPVFLVKCISDYFIERYLVVYYYREPPAYDETMTKNFISFCRFFIMVGLAMSFWQLGCRQIFDNILFPITTADEPQKSGHFVW